MVKRRVEMVSVRFVRFVGGLFCCFNVRIRGIFVRYYYVDIEFSGVVYFR